MRIYLKLAWRNVFRNKRRTFIAGTAIGIGLAALMFSDAVFLGMQESMTHTATASFMGEAQIHEAEFREQLEVERTIHNLADVTARLEQEHIVERFAPRTLSIAMISSPANAVTVSMVGVDPERERHLSQIDEALSEGSYFADGNEQALLIGRKLADLLEVDLGGRVVITAAQAHTGDLAQELFRVSGIYEFNVAEMDEGMAFVRIARARQMLNLAGQAHEIAIKFSDLELAGIEGLPFWADYSTDGNEAVGWPTLMPELAAIFDLMIWSTLIMGLILFGVVSLGIVNTLFMSLYERMFEFGVLRAVGTRPLAMGRLILFEAAALALVSVVLGIILGYLVTYIFTLVGIDYTGVEFAGATIRELLYPVVRWQQFAVYPVLVFVFTILMGIYPASYAARMVPAVAMRKSL